MNRKVADVLWLALQFAKQDRITLMQAYCDNPNEPVVKEALRDIKAFEALQMKLFGTTKSRMEINVEQARRIDVYDLIISGLTIEEFVAKERKEKN